MSVAYNTSLYTTGLLISIAIAFLYSGKLTLAQITQNYNAMRYRFGV